MAPRSRSTPSRISGGVPVIRGGIPASPSSARSPAPSRLNRLRGSGEGQQVLWDIHARERRNGCTPRIIPRHPRPGDERGGHDASALTQPSDRSRLRHANRAIATCARTWSAVWHWPMMCTASRFAQAASVPPASPVPTPGFADVLREVFSHLTRTRPRSGWGGFRHEPFPRAIRAGSQTLLSERKDRSRSR